MKHHKEKNKQQYKTGAKLELSGHIFGGYFCDFLRASKKVFFLSGQALRAKGEETEIYP